MFQKKEKMYLGGFLRSYLTLLIKSKVTIDTGTTKIPFTSQEEDLLKEELQYVRYAVLMFQLLEIGKFGKKKFNSEEIGYAIGYALCLAYQDLGESKKLAEDKLERLNGKIEFYGRQLEKVEKSDPANLKKRGVYFYILSAFADLFTNSNSNKLRVENFRNKHFLVFEFGNQMYKQDLSTFRQAIKRIEFMDED